MGEHPSAHWWSRVAMQRSQRHPALEASGPSRRRLCRARDGGRTRSARAGGALDRSPPCAHDPAMPSDRLAKLLKLAEELPEDERVELARELLRGLTDDVDELEDDLDRDELRRRIAAVQDGTATLIPWEEARQMVRRDG